ncbi:dihydrofolate reductase [Sporolactobacillus sp. Y61]|jgi:dihydrofolate reductase|uniref:Dihydrofolate reductase n=1 Tax=Sporolactobacillus sp. Y61 TaxID=3160863 RepID=A0AAU8ID77_9BACL|nr:dihydrofolate reductase [Sporolactobacillus sp. THM19-2]RYL92193.1 dihydrofolate reductase [Sporolactobacillus sp. THM19-2]
MISFLVAMDINGLIGRKNKLPWHLPADLKYFKKVTMGHPIIMGRKTFESIGRPLPGRKNIVFTRHTDFSHEGVTVFHSSDAFLKSGIPFGRECFIIGGNQIFQTFAPYADRLYLTRLHAAFEGDTYFTAFHEKEWKLVSEKEGKMDQYNVFPYTFQIYERA